MSNCFGTPSSTGIARMVYNAIKLFRDKSGSWNFNKKNVNSNGVEKLIVGIGFEFYVLGIVQILHIFVAFDA